MAGYALMSNHEHVIVQMNVSTPRTWSASELARRWVLVYPKKYQRDETSVLPSDAAIAEIAPDAVKVGLWRTRLADLGWFMNASMEPIARRANRGDDCSGAF